jgi:hypothetical protein
MARGAWAAGVAADAADAAAEVEVLADADPHGVGLPSASPATTQGVLSELISILLPGGCVMAMVAVEEVATGADELVAAGGAAEDEVVVVAPGVELAAAGVVAEGVAAEGVAAAAAGVAAGAAADERPENAVATSEEDR